DVWSSSDGVTWKLVTNNAQFIGRAGHTSVVLNNKIWVVGGLHESQFLNDVWLSSDGANWQQAVSTTIFPVRWVHSSVAFKDRVWVVGGWDGNTDRNDVWYLSPSVPVEVSRFVVD